jgi:hypothetical protein
MTLGDMEDHDNNENITTVREASSMAQSLAHHNKQERCQIMY